MATEVPFNGDPDDGQTVWYRDVLPIARQHCQGCHQPNAIGPFSMMTYKDAAPMADKIKAQVMAGTMPPWMPEDTGGCMPLEGKRQLNDAEKTTIKKWVDGGALPGDPKHSPPGADGVIPHLSQVDLVLKPNTVYTPIGDPSDPSKLDDYHCFVIPTGMTQDVFVTGFEIEPGVTREVHHATMYTVPLIAAQLADAATPEPGYTCFGGPGLVDGGLGGWLPGTPPTEYPDGTGVRISTLDAIVLQVHYNMLNGPPEPDQTTLKLRLASSVPMEARYIPIADLNMKIPSGNHDYHDTIAIPSPFAGKVWGVLPHMHTLGQTISVKMNSQCLLDIPAWNFHWQQGYFFETPTSMPIKLGDLITLDCGFNNTTGHDVKWGETTADEMCLAFLYGTL
jgi:hypothetical protein